MKVIAFAAVIVAALMAACDAEEAGEMDWATEVTGNPWDMEARNDLGLAMGPANARFESGVAVIQARQGGRQYLSLHGHLVDGNRYNKMKVRARAKGSVKVAVDYLSALNPYYPFAVRATSAYAAIGTEWETVELSLPLDRGGAAKHPELAILQVLGLVFQCTGTVPVEIDWVKLERDESVPSQADILPPHQDYRHTHEPLPELDMSFVDEPLFTFAVFTDPHFSQNLGPRERKQQELVKQINALGVDFAFNLGDTITSSPWSPNFKAAGELAKGVLGELKMPLYYVPGNHDVGNKVSFIMNKDKGFGNRGVTEETIRGYEELFGAPAYHSFDYEGCHFAYIDTMGFGSDTSDDEEQMEWLEKDLAGAQESRFRFLFGHVHPMYKDMDEPGEINYDAIDQPDRRKLLELCDRYGVDIFMFGHTHQLFFNRYGRTRLLTLGSSGFPRWARWHLSGDPDFKLNYAVVRVYEDRYEVNLVRIPEPVLHPAKLQESNSAPARQVITELSDEHEFAVAGVNADLVTEDMLAWSQSNLNDGLTIYPGEMKGNRAAGVAWSSEPVSSSNERVEVKLELRQGTSIKQVRVIGVEGKELPKVTVSLKKGTEAVATKAGEIEAGEGATVAEFDGDEADAVMLVLENLPADPDTRGNFSARVAEVEVIDSEGRNVALKEYGTRVKASSNRTIRSSGVYNSNPIFTDERQWYLLRDLGVNLVRLDPGSFASRMVMRDGKLTLHPPTRALLEELAEDGIRFVIRLSMDTNSPSGAGAEKIARYVATEFPEPQFIIEVDGRSEREWLTLAKSVAEAAPGRKVILGGMGVEWADILPRLGVQPLRLARGICLGTHTGMGTKATFEAAEKWKALLEKVAGEELELYVSVEGAPSGVAGDFAAAARFLTEWTIEAAKRKVTLFWWHATKGDRPFFAFFRGEEPTLPAYALRLLATLLAGAEESVPYEGSAPAIDGVIFAQADGADVLGFQPREISSKPVDMKLPYRATSAQFIDLLAGTAQEAGLAQREGQTLIPNVIVTEKPLLVRVKREKD